MKRFEATSRILHTSRMYHFNGSGQPSFTDQAPVEPSRPSKIPLGRFQNYGGILGVAERAKLECNGKKTWWNGLLRLREMRPDDLTYTLKVSSRAVSPSRFFSGSVRGLWSPTIVLSLRNVPETSNSSPKGSSEPARIKLRRSPVVQGTRTRQKSTAVPGRTFRLSVRASLAPCTQHRVQDQRTGTLAAES